MGSEVEGSITVLIHPLVMVNVSEHHTRLVSMGQSSSRSSVDSGRASGILLGSQNGRVVELKHSFELKETADGGFDIGFRDLRLEQYKQIFPDLAVMGWYACGDQIAPSDMERHKSIMSLNDSPLFLLLNPSEARSTATTSSSALLKSLPITIYESDYPPTKFKTAPFSFHSTDSERIAVDHVIRHAATGEDTGSSILVQHLTTMHRATSMLEVRVDVIKRFLEATSRGDVPWDPVLLRRAAEVCKDLPSMQLDDFTRALNQESNDVKIVSYLAGVTKSLCLFNELVENFNRNYSRVFRALLHPTFDPLML